LISSDVVYEYGKSDHLLVPAHVERVNANFRLLSDKALADLHAASFKDDDMIIMRSIDMRYRYQVHELNVPLLAESAEITNRDMENLYAHFDGLYEKSYGKGSGYAEAGREITTFRVTATGKLKKPNIKRHPVNGVGSESHKKGERKVYFEEYGDFVRTIIYDFDRMNPGTKIFGPAVIETPITTIVLNPTDSAVMDEFHNVRIVIGHGEPRYEHTN
jgi:N-methylhydantoinase A